MFRRATIVGMLLAAGAAQAELRVFENPNGQFPFERSWWSMTSVPVFHRGDGLDITQPSTQSGKPSPLTLLYVDPISFTSSDFKRVNLEAEGAVRFDMSGPVVTFQGPGSIVLHWQVMRMYQQGELVGPGAQWSDAGVVGYHRGAASSPLLGSEAIVGLELMIDGAAHYGWVGLRWDTTGVDQYRATMWGYETEAGAAALVVPAPSVMALALGLGGTTCARRRR